MGAGRFVGRVGGLAVVLGVGAAVTVGNAVAWADEGKSSDSSSGTASSAGSSSSTPSAKGQHQRPAPRGKTKKPAADSDTASEDSGAAPAAADTPKSPAKSKNRQFGSPANKPNKPTKIDTPKPESKTDSKPESKVKVDLSPAVKSAASTAAVAVQPKHTTTAVAPVATSSVVAAASQVTVSSTESATASTPSALSEISQALLGTGPEGTPVASPLSWVVAAAARRELGAVPTAAVSAAGTTTSTNHIPVIKSVTVGKPDASTGEVTGKVTAADADADPLTYSASASTKGGSVTIDATTGVYTYAPTAAARHNAATGATAAKTDTFTVTATDVNGGAASKTVTVTVLPANAKPVITPSNSQDPATGVVTGNINVTDADNDTLAISLTGTTKKGKLTFDKTTGAYTYTPTAAAMHAAATGAASPQADTFTVKVTDAHGGTTIQQVSVPIKAININPVVASPLGVTKTSSTSGVVLGKITVTDADKDKLTYTATTDAAKGKVSVSSSGAFTFTPTAAARHAAAADGATDADKQTTVTVTVSDGHGGTPITQTVTVDIVGKNANPGGVTVKVGKADVTTGVVTGTVKATDADKDSLTYGVNATSTKGGTVSIDGAGNITYTASDAARYAAGAKGATSATKTDTITLNVTDGHGGLTTKIVTVAVAPLAATSQGSVSNTGSVTISGNSYDAVFNADGSRAIITTKGTDGTSKYTVVDPRTGQQIGTATTLTGDAWTAQFSANGSRAVIYTDAKNANVDVTNVAVIDTVSGAQLGTTVTLTGVVSNTLPFSSAGDRAVVVAFGTDNDVYTGQIAVLDLLTGLQVGSTTSVTGDSKASSVNVKLNAQGTRAVVTLETGSTAKSTSLNIIDTATGDAVSTGATIAGTSNWGTQIAAGGTRAVLAVTNDAATSTVVTVFDLATGEADTYTQDGTGSAQLTDDGTRLVVNTGTVVSDALVAVVATYNAITGEKIGTATLAGVSSYLPVQFNGDQTHAVVTVYNLVPYQGQTYISNTGVAVVDLATGAQVGKIVKVVGEPIFDNSGPVNIQLNSDGSRAVITGVVTASSGSATTYFAVVDTATGLQLGKTLKLAGGVQVGADSASNFTGYEMLPVFTADGKTAIITTFTGSDAKGYATHVAVLNLVKGTQLGKTINVAGGVDIAGKNGYPVVQLGTSDTRALITTFVGDDQTLYTTRVVLINTQTGGQIGKTRSYTAYYQTSTQFSEDGNRIIIDTDDLKFNSAGTFTQAVSTLTLLDAYTGSPIGSPVAYSANEWTWSTSYNGDTRVAMVQISSDATGAYTTRITVVDPITGTVIGQPIDVAGEADTVTFGADNAHLVVTTVTGDTTTVSFLNIDPQTTVV